MLRKNNLKINRFKRKIKNFFKGHKVKIILGIVLFLFVYIINFLYHIYIDNPTNIVSSVYFDKKIVDNPSLLNLVKETKNVFSGANTAKNKIFKYKNEINQIKTKFSYINQIKIDVLSKNSLQVSYNFKKPNLIFIGSGFIFPVYDDNKIYKFNINYISGLNLNINTKIHLPSYITSENNLKGIFWKNSKEKLINYIKAIKKQFPKSQLFYIVGGENIKVINNGKILFFSLSKDIEKQINQLKLIKTKQVNLYKDAKQLDIGNLEDGVYLKIENKGK